VVAHRTAAQRRAACVLNEWTKDLLTILEGVFFLALRTACSKPSIVLRASYFRWDSSRFNEIATCCFLLSLIVYLFRSSCFSILPHSLLFPFTVAPKHPFDFRAVLASNLASQWFESRFQQ